MLVSIRFAATIAVAILGQATVVKCWDSTQLKVMSFNLRTSLANDPCPSGCWALRKFRAEQLVERYEPDFIGTQEGAPDQIDFFIHQLGFTSTGECAGNCDGNERNSIFYKTERWDLLESSTFALSDTPNVIPSNSWNLQYLRAAVIARFRDKATHQVVCMLNTHFDISRGHDQSSSLVAKLLSEHCDVADTIILTGDLNTGPESPAIKYLSNQDSLNGSCTPVPMYDTLAAAGVGGPTWVGSSFGNITVDYKFDYIFLRPDDHTCLLNSLILVDLFDGFSSSDHAVVQSEFSLGKGCTSDFQKAEPLVSVSCHAYDNTARFL
ncbi:hypothetical protein CCR75_008751 [Bremia lactucae]|uniref:Endonuclease/exonuclease/phosphatase domain-containing protein n=1 Tax=Bremia lactucae TaxID=4779 RepID=A0A976IK23_BRELC|nr:hypothetical protein CCR75_008751 [Bremia lactucae]